jgi:hypothetical protein
MNFLEEQRNIKNIAIKKLLLFIRQEYSAYISNFVSFMNKTVLYFVYTWFRTIFLSVKFLWANVLA